MAVDIVESSGKRPGQANGDDGYEDVLDRDCLQEGGKLRHGTR